MKNKRLKKLKRHLLRQTTLVQFQLRPNDNYRTPRVVHAFAQQVLTEATALAFDHGVLDFITKPISESRFKLAVDRYLSDTFCQREQLKYLSIKSKGQVKLLPIAQIDHIKAAGNYTEIVLHRPLLPIEICAKEFGY